MNSEGQSGVFAIRCMVEFGDPAMYVGARLPMRLIPKPSREVFSGFTRFDRREARSDGVIFVTCRRSPRPALERTVGEAGCGWLGVG